MKRNKFRELLSYPYLFIKVFITNFLGKKKYQIETYYYGDNKQQNIRIVKPKEETEKDTVIFFCHGGGWKRGGSKIFRFVGYYFASMGYTTIVAEYRKAPKHTHPKQEIDTANALKLGMEKVSGDKVVLVGQSAGAHLVTLIGYNDTLNKIGFDQDMIKGIVSISGPISFNECKNHHINKLINGFVLNEEERKQSDAYRYINKDANLPLLCIHGDHDPTVEVNNSIQFVDKLNEFHSGLGTLLIIEGGLHSNLVKLFWRGLSEHTKMIDWIKHLEQ